MRCELGPVDGEQRLSTTVDHRHDGVVAVTQSLANRANEGGREQRRVDAAGEGELGLPGERAQAHAKPASGPPYATGSSTTIASSRGSS